MVQLVSGLVQRDPATARRGFEVPLRQQRGFFAGGGVQGGRVIGSSDKKGEFPASDPQKPEDFAATIYDALGLPPNISWHDPVQRPHFLYHGMPMTKLFA